MSTLFGEPSPVRVVIHVNLHRGALRFDWDLAATNPDTGDLLAMSAHVQLPRHALGPELSRMLLAVQELLSEGSRQDPRG
jgi:hypothetical protein